MTWNATAPTLRGRLARHLGRLQHNLDAVGEQVREAVATAVGRTMAEAIGEAVYDALCPHADTARPWTHASQGGIDPLSGRSWNESTWERDAPGSDWRDPYEDNDDDPLYDGPESSSYLRDEPRVGRWRHAVVAGLQAAAWWLRRYPDRVSLGAAVAVGAVAGLGVLVGHASGVAGVVMSVLGLAYLLDLLRGAGALFVRDSRP